MMDGSVLQIILVGVVSGLLGLASMSGVIGILSSYESLTVGPVRAIGTLLNPQVLSARSVGWLVHVVSAIAFGILYTGMLSTISPPAEIIYLLAAGSFGLGHGFVVFFMLIPLFADHPAQIVRNEGSYIGLDYIFAHIAFGLTVGSVFILLT